MDKSDCEISMALWWMFNEMSIYGLDVVLAPAPDQRHSTHCIRVIENRNPEWYRRLCSRHLLVRKDYLRPRTKVRRRFIMSVLLRMVSGKKVKSKYVEELKSEARLLLEEWDIEREEMGNG